MRERPAGSFAWNNWVADLLQIEFLYVCLTCPKDLLSSCCDLLIRLPGLIRNARYFDLEKNAFPHRALLNSLGSNPYQRMYDCFQVVYGSSPSELQLNISTAYTRSADVAMESTKLVDCSCLDQERCDPAYAWWLNLRRKAQRDCRRVQV